jgi:hypothetical protein
MTKKKKSAKSKDLSSNKKNDAITSPLTESSSPPAASKGLSKGQLAGLIFLTIGVSKLMEYAKATKEAGTENPATCLSYLDEETCNHKSFGSLISLKYHTGMQVTLLVVSLMRQCWQSEEIFQKLNALLCISPLGSTLLALVYGKGAIKNGARGQILIMCFVLIAVAFPATIQGLPFVSNQPWAKRSLQAICLMTLAIIPLIDVIKVLSSGDLANSILETETNFPEPARGLVYFYLVDKITMALLFVFALVHLPEQHQRVRLLVRSYVYIPIINRVHVLLI